LQWTARHFAEKQIEFPRLDAEVLIAHALQCRRIELYTRYDEIADDGVRQRLRDLVRRRVEGCPVAYLVGRKEFFGLTFDVNSSVLIPRPESEFVVMECLRLAENLPEPRILDIGTGSGNIAITLAHQRRDAWLWAVDISPAALLTARKNAERDQASKTRVQFVEGDLFEPVEGREFDFVVSNPPYIAREELDHLPVGVRQYEPLLALDGGPGGYEVAKKIIDQAPNYLKAGGHLILEIGGPQEDVVRQFVSARQGFELADTILDYSGHPRVVRARWAP
jgi:release factor glutamine methyltransferase